MTNPVLLPPRYLTLTHKPQENLLERRHLVELLFALFQSGNRWIVVHGESGVGKTTLANALFHSADQRNAYQQFGWMDYSINLSKSLERAFISNREVPEGKEKSEAFYDRVAREEAGEL